MDQNDKGVGLKHSVGCILWKSVGHMSPRGFSQLHPTLLEQSELQLGRAVWVLLVLAQGGAKHSGTGFEQQSLSQRLWKAQIVPGTVQQCTAVLCHYKP